jgi:hypothetical protein
MWPPVARATSMPRPAKPARRTRDARVSIDDALAVASLASLRVAHAFRTKGAPPRNPAVVAITRAYPPCRAGFAGRGMQPARTTPVTLSRRTEGRRPTPDPKRSLGSE